MRKSILIVSAILFCVQVSAQNKVATVSGKIAVKDIQQVILCHASEGIWIPVDTCNIGENNSFTFTIATPEEGVWSVKDAKKERYRRSYHARFYLSAGDKICLNIGDKIEHYAFAGNVSRENKLFFKWCKIYDNMFNVSQTYRELYPKVEKFISDTEAMKKETTTSNKLFNEIFAATIQFDSEFGFFQFKVSPNSCHPTAEEIHPIYAKILSEQKFDNDQLLNYPDGASYMSIFSMVKNREKLSKVHKGEIDKTALDVTFENIGTDKLKGVSFAYGINNYRTYEDFIVDYNKHSHYLYSDLQKEIANNFIAKTKRFAIGQHAIDFTYPDKNGENVSLSDFKGKVVLVDVWATWCAPCREQIPYLKKLEKEFHGKDIVFLGVSVDVETKREEWLAMLEKEGLEGIQLFTGQFGGSKICNDYDITGVPRFMLFDKKGNIISVSAPRPSSPELKELLIKLVNER